jgi:Protein phosphatase 2C
MSDSKHSDVGANVAASAVVGEIRVRLDRGVSLGELDASDIFAATAGQMIGAAEQRRWSHDDVRCALAVAVIPAAAENGDGRRAWLAALADVTVWLWRPGGWLPLIGDLKEGADVSPLDHYLPYHPEKSATRLVRLGPDAVLAVTTDGIGDAISMLPGAAAWFADRWRTPRNILSFVQDIGYEDIQFNDDRTAVVIWCMNRYSDP